MLYTRIDQGGQENPQCIGYVFQKMLTSNNKMVYSSIKMTHYGATKQSNAIDADYTI